MAVNAKGLTPKEEIFIKQYLTHFNGVRACREAGYKGNDNVLGVRSHRMLRKGKIAGEIRRQKRAKMKKLDTGIDAVLEELAFVAFSRMGRYARIKNGKLRVTDTEALEEEGLDAAIKSYTESVTEHGGSIGLKMHDKIKALELLGKYNGMWDRDGADDGDSENNRESERDRLLRAIGKVKLG